MLDLVTLSCNVTLLLLIFVRMTGCTVFSPIFGRTNIPVVIRVGLTFMLSLFPYQLVSVRTVVLPSFLIFFITMLRELLLGFLIDSIIQMFLSVILIGGENMDMQIGIPISKTCDPQSNVSIPISGPFINTVFFLLFFVTGTRRALIQVFMQLCAMVPYGELAIDRQVFSRLAELFRLILTYAAKMLLPIMASQLTTEFVVDLAMKTVPRLNTLMINIQIKALLGFGILFPIAGPLASFLGGMIGLMFDQIGGVYRMLMQRGTIPADSKSGAKGRMTAPDSNRTEEAAPKKRGDERKEGNIFQSTDIVSALSLLVVFMILRMALPHSYEFTRQFLARYFSCTSSMDRMMRATVIDITKDCTVVIFSLAGSIVFASVAAAVVGTGIQTKLKFSRKRIKFKLSNISPLQGLKRIFPPRPVVELFKSIIKITIVPYLLYTSLLSISNDFMKPMLADVYQGALLIPCNIMSTALKLCVVLIVIFALGCPYQWWEYERNTHMSKRDLKEEYKQMEGDPSVKSQQHECRRRMSMQRMIQQVPIADVIVRNPAHFAVTLHYDIERDAAPMVVAKGQGYSALRIIEVAEEHHIPMTENKPLTQTLYREVKVDWPIPAEYYVVLAEIMAWVYPMKKGSADIEGSK